MAIKEIKSGSLTTGWAIIEKIIALALGGTSIFILYSEVSTVMDFLNSGLVKTGRFTYWEMFEVHHLPIIVSMLGVFGGSFLLFNDKTGWLLSLIALFILGIFFFMSAKTNAASAKLEYANFYKSYGLTAIAFLVFFILLILKPFRHKYKPTSKNWFWLLGILLVLFIDKIIF